VTWQLASFSLLFLALAAGFAWYERARPPAKVVALVATLAALAALGRAAFAPLPNVKPTTDIVLLSGYALGAGPGFVVGAVAALASNLFFGQGPHTPWQMAGWGGAGLLGAALAHAFGRDLGRWPLAAVCGFAGFAFGAWMDLHLWVLFTDHRPAEYLLIFGRSVPFNVAHVVGNVVFCLIFGPAFVRALLRFRRRFDIVWRPLAPAGAALAAVLVLAAPASAADRTVERAVAYLRAAQTADGGFAGVKGGESSNAIYSSWVIIGLAAAGEDPGEAAARYIRRQADTVTDAGDIERTLLALRAAGEPADDLAQKLLRVQGRDGSIEGLVNRTAFLVISLRATGRPASDPAVRRATSWLVRQQNRRGGFGTGGLGSPPSIDDTAAAIQGLVQGGRSRRSRPVLRAGAWLVRRQNADGGFPLGPGTPSNAQSTAWAVQALVAAGRDPRRVRRNRSRSPIAYLRSLQGADGSIRYSRTSRQVPTWVTSQALAAIMRKPMPVRAPAAARAAARRRAERERPLAALLSVVAAALFP
jgi:energy-coupling factor transport system substrate-specific component